MTAGFPVSEHLLTSDINGILKEFLFKKYMYFDAKLLSDELIVSFAENLLTCFAFRASIIGHILYNCQYPHSKFLEHFYPFHNIYKR